jgi:NADPH-dependent curcumin reductase CurA
VSRYVSGVNRKVVLARRPSGLPEAADFRVEEEALQPLASGMVQVDVERLSIDAFLRTVLEEEAYHGSVPIGGTVMALGVGRIRASESSGFSVGDAVMGPLGAQTVATLPEAMIQKVDAERAPLSAYLGVLGLTAGLTAYMGVRHVGQVKPGDTFVVSAAAGAVGSLAGQIAGIDGARVIGIAGGPQKVKHLTEVLGFDAAIDYKGEDVDARLRELAPDGIDVFFDNVGGELLDVVLDQIVEGSRIVICGAISQYQTDMSKGVRGPSLYLRLAERHARMEGFAVNHFADRYGEAEAALAGWLASGEVQLHEHVEQGLDHFGETLRMLFTGGHTGKLLLAP